MLEGGSARLKPEKRQEMEERVNILTTFIRSMLNDRDAWKKHDAVSNRGTHATPCRIAPQRFSPNEVHHAYRRLSSLPSLLPPVWWLVRQGLKQKKSTEDTSEEDEDGTEGDEEVVLEESDGDL